MAMFPPPTPQQLVDNQGPGIIAANLTTVIIATIAVFVRLLVRRSQKAGLGPDDYMVVAALPFGWGLCVCMIIAVRHGLGRHLNTLTSQPAALRVEAIAFTSSELIWAVSITLVKISILLLYIRIFGKMRSFRLTAYGMIAFTAAWGTMVVLVCALQCRPIQLIWDPTLHGSCINRYLFFVIGSAINCAADFVVLLLPIRATWNLQMPTVQRVSVIGIFSLGSVTCVFGVVRLAALIKYNGSWDATWALGPAGIWSTAEPCLGIFAACLPPLRPLFAGIFAKMASRHTGLSYRSDLSKGSKKEGRSRSAGGSRLRGAHNRSDSFQPLGDAEGDTRLDTWIASERDLERQEGGHAAPAKGLPKNAIAIETRTSWSGP